MAPHQHCIGPWGRPVSDRRHLSKHHWERGKEEENGWVGHGGLHLQNGASNLVMQRL